jgi:hypothetical protein
MRYSERLICLYLLAAVAAFSLLQHERISILRTQRIRLEDRALGLTMIHKF